MFLSATLRRTDRFRTHNPGRPTTAVGEFFDRKVMVTVWAQPEIAQVLITVKTYPSPSGKYGIVPQGIVAWGWTGPCGSYPR